MTRLHRLLTLVVFLFVSNGSILAQSIDVPDWSGIDRVWVGPEFWANRLQDWSLVGGELQCLNDELPRRTVHVLTRRLAARAGWLNLEVEVGWPWNENPSDEASVGFLIGAGASGLDYRAAALIHSRTGSYGGYYAGIERNGTLFVTSHQGLEAERIGTSAPIDFGDRVILGLALTGVDGLVIQALDPKDRTVMGELRVSLPETDLSGSLALVSHLVKASFGRWKMDGSRLETHTDRNLGPIVATKYTVSEKIMTMTAQFMPIGEADNRIARLQVNRDGTWTDVAVDDVASPGYVAVFRIRGWDASRSSAYRVIYDLKAADGDERRYEWSGTIRNDPARKETITVAAFTGNHNTWGGFEGTGPYAFDTSHLWFPHNDIVDHVRKHEPDLLFFSGDQVYEGASPTRADRGHIMLDYLYKWVLYCWAYRDLTKDIPSVVIPDDHDVYQGNVWGEGGRRTDLDTKGGYVHDADFVRLVEKTQTANLPPAVDPRPIDQGIGVYFTGLKWGRIGFAVIEDRKFKSGPNGRIEGAASGRADHINNPEYDTRRADVPGLRLLGDRQLAFLEDWAQEWRGEDMKAVLSQTVFANMATHHGGNLFKLIADLDSNGWPQTGRNKALAAIRKGFAVMIAGDQHLSTVVHHGIDAQHDAGVSFAVPSIANFYPRAWQPDQEGQNRPPGAPAYLGEHLDGFQNLVTVLAVYNPPGLTGISTGVEPLLLNDRAPGYGIIRFNKADRSITLENWPRHADPDAPDARQYEGWPIVVSQEDNYGREAAAYLPTVMVTGLTDPVVRIINETSGEVVYTIRVKGASYRPKVFDPEALYTIAVGDTDTDTWQKLQGVAPLGISESVVRVFSF